jgi:molybdopterin-guanine dinucleotide biosynthesis protein A
MMNPPYDVTGLILAGGESKRMGRPKAMLDVGGVTLVGRVLAKVAPLCREVILVTRRPSDFLSLNVTTVRDLIPGQGPLGGLATGLFYAHYPWALVLACDLPFLQTRLLDYLIRRALNLPPGPRAVVPRNAEGWQPLVAMYSRSCLGPARTRLGEGRRKVGDLREKLVNWLAVDEEEFQGVGLDFSSFDNVNTPEDLASARTIITGEV